MLLTPFLAPPPLLLLLFFADAFLIEAALFFAADFFLLLLLPPPLLPEAFALEAGVFSDVTFGVPPLRNEKTKDDKVE